MVKFKETEAFKKDVKKLKKKYKTLSDDIKELKRILKKLPLGTGNHFVLLTEQKNIKIIKGRLFCRSLKGQSLRIVYAYSEDGDLTMLEVTFVEVFFKGDKSREDQKRIEEYLKAIK